MLNINQIPVKRDFSVTHNVIMILLIYFVVPNDRLLLLFTKQLYNRFIFDYLC